MFYNSFILHHNLPWFLFKEKKILFLNAVNSQTHPSLELEKKEVMEMNIERKKKRVQGKMAFCPNVTPVVEKTLFKNWVGE